MAEHLVGSRPVLIGVGAAFDFHTGRVRQAPRWMQRAGLEWLFRLGTEPRRLGPRYLKNNPLFAMHSPRNFWMCQVCTNERGVCGQCRSSNFQNDLA